MERQGPLYMMVWRATRVCNYNCAYCSFASNPSVSGEVDTEGGKRIVDEVYDFGGRWFGISGGEALMRDDLFDIIAHARDIGLNVSLIANGHFVKGETLDKLVKYEVHTAVSVDGTEETNDALRGEGAYAKAVSAMEKLSQHDLLACLVTTLTNTNYKEVDHVVDLANKYNAGRTVFHNYIPVGRAQEHLELAPSPEQYDWVWNRIYDLLIENRGDTDVNVYCPFFARVAKQRGMPGFQDWYKNTFLGRCFMAGGYLGIVENGDVRRCGFHEDYRLGNIRDKSLKEFWDELQHSELTRKLRDKDNLKGKCGVCEYREICGGCRTRAEIYTGDLFESDPACSYIPKQLREN